MEEAKPPEPAQDGAEGDVERQTTDVVIVGAGAAGLATAIFARRQNATRTVRLIDSATRPGAKILVSGGSRCNVTNAVVHERDFNGGNPAIIRRILKAFPPPQVISWFGSLGVDLHEEAHGKLFPDSNRSRDVLNALLDECHSAGVEFHTGTRVEQIDRGDSFSLITTAGTVRARIVVMATGGLSLPKTGSDGRGLSIAESLGHTIVPTTPALAPLILGDDPALHRLLTGVAHDVELTLWIDNSIDRRLHGSLLWTHFGLSGPVVLDMSRHWLRARLDNRPAGVTINFTGGHPFESIEQQWTRHLAARPRITLQGLVAEYMPAAAAAAILAQLAFDPSRQAAQLSRSDRRHVIHALTEWRANVTDSRGYNYAEATAGDIALEEIDPATMQSRRCPNLYVVGEMLDVDGRIGGFNFQWAWCSARVAARAIAARAL